MNLQAIKQEAEQVLAPLFGEIDRIAEQNTAKILTAFREHHVSYTHFAATDGYGYDDIGRDTLEKIWADVFGAVSGNEPIDVLTTPKTVLGDVINNDAVRLGDSLQSDTMDVATKVAAGSVKSLRDAMGLNDKFVIMRDLFDDDRMRFEVVIDELDAQETFDDAMIYISGFAWNSASEGAKLLMNLLKLKFV